MLISLAGNLRQFSSSPLSARRTRFTRDNSLEEDGYHLNSSQNSLSELCPLSERASIQNWDNIYRHSTLCCVSCTGPPAVRAFSGLRAHRWHLHWENITLGINDKTWWYGELIFQGIKSIYIYIYWGKWKEGKCRLKNVEMQNFKKSCFFMDWK